MSRNIPSFWVLLGLVALSIPFTSLNNWYFTTNVQLNLLANSMPILLCMPTSLPQPGSGSGPTHTQEGCVESHINTLTLSAQLTVLLLRMAVVVLLLISSLRLILQSTRFEGEEGGILGLAGQGVTKIASGQLE
eukprot:1153918-Pelagomonas_calceolata.AAC.2